MIHLDDQLVRSTPNGPVPMRHREIVAMAQGSLARSVEATVARKALARRYARNALMVCDSGSASVHTRTWAQWARLADLALHAQKEARLILAVTIENHCGVTVTGPGIWFTFWPPHTEHGTFDFGDAVPPDLQPLAWRLAYAVKVYER